MSLDQPEVTGKFQPNPYPTGKVLSFDPGSFRAFADHVREQHDKLNSGDTSHSWEILTEVSNVPLYTLGSQGRFFHPDFGLIKARYVQFANCDPTLNPGSPYGLVKSQNKFNWLATNRLELSQPNLCLGLGGSYAVPTDGQFGWVVFSGANIQSVPFVSSLVPEKLKQISWLASGQTGYSDDATFGLLFAESSFHLVSAGSWLIRPGGVYITCEELLAGVSDSLAQKISNLENRLDELLNGPINNRIGQIETKLNEVSNTYDAALDVLQARVASINDGDVFASLQNAINLTAQYANAAQTAASNSDTLQQQSYINAQATNISEQQAKIWRDETEVFVQSATIFSNSALINSNNATLQAVAAQGFATSASESAAAAESFSILAASSGGSRLNDNSSFAAWPVSNAIPDGWVANNGTYTRGVGIVSPNSLIITSNAGQDGGFARTLVGSTWPPRLVDTAGLNNKYFVVGGKVKLLSGALTASGILLALCNVNGVVLSFLGVNFATDVDTRGLVNGVGVVGATYTFSKVVRVNQPACDRLLVYAVGHDTTLGSITAANSIEFYETYVRDATDSEIETQVAIPAIEASIISESSARVSGDNALATSVTSLTAAVNGNSGNITTLQTVQGTHTGNLTVLNAKYSVKLDVNGKATGFELNDDGSTTQFAVNADNFRISKSGATDKVVFDLDTVNDRLQLRADLYLGTGKIVWQSGSVMMVAGTGFGTANQFLLWAGPITTINAANESSAIFYIKTNGDAYFGGSLTAGSLRNATSTSSLASNASVTLGPYGSNGGSIEVIVSYSYKSTTVKNYPATSQGLIDFNNDAAANNAVDQGDGSFAGSFATSASVTVTLTRDSPSAGLVATLTVNGGTISWFGIQPIVGDSSGSSTRTFNCGGSQTYTDMLLSTSGRTYTALITSRTIGTGTTTNEQRVSIISTED